MASSDETPPGAADSGQAKPSDSREHWLVRHRGATFVLPLVVYMLSAQLEPKPVASEADTSAAVQTTTPAANESDQSDPFGDDPAGETADTPAQPGFASPESGTLASYPLVYALRIGLTLAAIALVWPGYRQFPWKWSAWSLAVGLLGAVVWVGLANLQEHYFPLQDNFKSWLGGKRSAYNPFLELQSQPLVLGGFLAVRFLGLALIVPLIEEMFLRGFLMRFVMQTDWWQLAIGSVSPSAVAAMLVYAAMTHPGEMLAALAWFSLVTLLIARTKNIWNAVIAHAVTNLLLGIWVLCTQQWWLW